MLSAGLSAYLACAWEATARKPGNVHRFRDFDDLTYLDFLTAGAAVAPVLDRAAARRVGQTVLDAVRATRQVAKTNVNLGIVLLLAPLAAVPDDEDLRAGVGKVLETLDVDDARLVFEAIRLAAPSGLGDAPEQDVRDEPTLPLRQVMALAAERDLVARQYANGYREVFDEGLPALTEELAAGATMEEAIIACQLRLLARHPDSLIARKRGPAVATEASRRAQAVRDSGGLEEFDAWLCADGHARNPGTTADLVAAALFVGLRTAAVPTDRRFSK
jgi:triphosphoribosyl-dephospho-CoA synthase